MAKTENTTDDGVKKVRAKPVRQPINAFVFLSTVDGSALDMTNLQVDSVSRDPKDVLKVAQETGKFPLAIQVPPNAG